MKKYEKVPLNSLTPQFAQWENILKHNGIGHIFFLPHTGLLYRVHQFSDWLKSRNLSASIIDLDLEMHNDPLSFREFLKSSSLPTLIVARRNFISMDQDSLSLELQSHYTTHSCAFLIFHETTPYTLTLNQNLPSVMLQNHFIYELPNKEFCLEYINSYAAEISLNITKQDISDIYQYCGNQPWLINELSRLKSVNPEHTISELITNDSMQKRLQSLWNGFPESHQMFFLDFPLDESLKTTIKNELTQAGYLNPTSAKPTGTWLEQIIKYQKSNLLKLSSDSLIYRGVELKNEFSAGELRILQTLYSTESPTPRDIVADAFWQSNKDELYTDWALDQAISRLRKKIARLKLPINILTKKGFGYVLQR